jgi:ABC-2 type transport system permease protein
LQRYIAEGRNLLVTGEPGKQYVLNPLLAELDVQLMNGQLVQPSYDETPDKVVSYTTKASAQISEGLQWLNERKPGDSSFYLVTPGATALTAGNSKGFKADTLAHTFAGRAWMKAGALVVDSILPPFNALEGDLKQAAFTTILQLTRKVKEKEQRVIVSGDADHASNFRIRYNTFFLLPAFSWLTYNSFPVYIPSTPDKDILLTISPQTAEVQKTVLIWVLPAVLLLASALLLIRRKRK